jgi:hypothetical protein
MDPKTTTDPHKTNLGDIVEEVTSAASPFLAPAYGEFLGPSTEQLRLRAALADLRAWVAKTRP